MPRYKIQSEGRGEIKVLVEQYTQLIVEMIDPDDSDRYDTYLDATDLVLNLAWSAVHSANTKGAFETLEALDDVRHLQRLARKRHSDS
tara:strand:+ start:682 stop:945 length:264 start_codon:yes stop_codon:yes gene_type:complete